MTLGLSTKKATRGIIPAIPYSARSKLQDVQHSNNSGGCKWANAVSNDSPKGPTTFHRVLSRHTSPRAPKDLHLHFSIRSTQNIPMGTISHQPTKSSQPGIRHPPYPNINHNHNPNATTSPRPSPYPIHHHPSSPANTPHPTAVSSHSSTLIKHTSISSALSTNSTNSTNNPPPPPSSSHHLRPTPETRFSFDGPSASRAEYQLHCIFRLSAIAGVKSRFISAGPPLRMCSARGGGASRWYGDR